MANGRTGLVIKPVSQLVEGLRSLYQRPPDTISGLDVDSWYCYDDKTEVLTRRGWLRWNQLAVNRDQIATRSPDGEFQWQELRALSVNEFDGELYHFTSRWLDIMVTADHRMLVDWWIDGRGKPHSYREGEIITAKQLFTANSADTGHERARIPLTSTWNCALLQTRSFGTDRTGAYAQVNAMRVRGKRSRAISRATGLPRNTVAYWLNGKTKRPLGLLPPVHMTGDDYAAFMGAYLSEGSFSIRKRDGHASHIIISQTKVGRGRREFHELLERIAPGRIKADERGFKIYSTEFAEYCRQFGHARRTKWIPEEILDAPPPQLDIFWHYYWLGDGLKPTSERMAGQLQEIAQKLGMTAIVRNEPRPDRYISDPDGTRRLIKASSIFTIGSHKNLPRAEITNKNLIQYKGKVWCPNVPNGIVYVRRNGKPAWCGQSPLQPVQPLAPPGTEPRQFQTWAGQNMIFTPRSDAEFSAADLKALATYPLARICIENVKDTVTRAPWEIQMRARPTESRKDVASKAKDNKETLLKLNNFFEYPDREHNWQEWLRPLLDDLLVIDAPSILIRQTYKGEIVELPVIRGEMISRLIDQNGFTPRPPNPAYQQNWWGLPLLDLTTDQLIYKPRNIVPRNTLASQLYGMCFDSETEILTRDRGFVRFPELRFSDHVATRNPETRELEWQKPTAYINEPYDGEMYAFTSQSMDLLVTPKHRMLVSVPTKGPNGRNEKTMTAEEFSKNINHERKIPVTSHWSGGRAIASIRLVKTDYRGQDVEISGDDFCALMGAYLAEGNRRSAGGIEVAQNKESKGFAEYSELFKRLNKNGTDGHNGKAFVCTYRALDYLFDRFGLAHEKFVPAEILNAPRRQLDIFWHYFHLGDGSFELRGNKSGRGQHGTVRHRATTTSKRLADHLVEIAQKLGFSASVAIRPAASRKFPGGRTSICRESYVVSCRYSKEMSVSAAREHYAGMVHCVTVPNGSVYVRRNGFPCWSKNSPTEQLTPEIQVGIKRLQFVLSYYTEGSVPGVVQVVPRGTSPDRIEEAMEWMNSQLAGNLAKRNQWRLVQGFNEPGKADQIVFSKEPLLAGLYDEKHIREIAYGYGTSPQRLMKMIRTEGKSSSDSAEVEGTLPWVLWVKGIIDYIIQRKMGFVDFEIAINPYAEPDPLKNAAALTMLVGKAVITPNEARKRVGEELRPEPEADQLGVITGTGFVPVGIGPATAGLMVDEKGQIKPHPVTPTAPPPKPAPAGGSNATRGSTPVSQEAGSGRSKGKNVGVSNGRESLDGKKKLQQSFEFEKRVGARIEAGLLTAESEQSVHSVHRTLTKVFSAQSKAAKAMVSRFHKTLGNILTKRSFGNVQFNLSAPDAQRVLEIPVDGAHFAAKARDMAPHITVLWGLHSEVTAAQINKITKGIGNIEVTIEGLEAFPEGEDGVPLVIRVESKKLRKLRADLEALPHTKSFHNYLPHVCIAYLKPDAPAAEYVAAGSGLEGETFTLSHLVYSGVDYTVHDLEKLTLPSERLRRLEARRSGKLTHAEVGYEQSKRTDRCEFCKHYRGPNDCALVEPPIAFDGWCQEFKQSGT